MHAVEVDQYYIGPIIMSVIRTSQAILTYVAENNCAYISFELDKRIASFPCLQFGENDDMLA